MEISCGTRRNSAFAKDLRSEDFLTPSGDQGVVLSPD
jgi:hypothetical protein